MGLMEAALFAAGIIIFILSFAIPARKEEISEETKQLAREEIRELINTEMENLRGNVADMAEETAGHAVDNAERSMERLSNEKIMAVNEYSDTVLSEINRNHNEVMFLYDMLNDKHKLIVNTVSDVQKKIGKVSVPKKKTPEPEKEEPVKETAIPQVLIMNGTEGNTRNNNERILELHNAGKSNIAIAQELGLGVGEVKLVIDLFEGM